MSINIMNPVVQKIKTTPLGLFSIHLDKSTDVVNCSQILVLVNAKYIFEGDLKDEFLFCKLLETTTTARDFFDKVD